MAEEFTHLRKSKPVVLAAGLIWVLIAYFYTGHGGDPHVVADAVHHNIMEFAELFLFLLVGHDLHQRDGGAAGVRGTARLADPRWF